MIHWGVPSRAAARQGLGEAGGRGTGQSHRLSGEGGLRPPASPPPWEKPAPRANLDQAQDVTAVGGGGRADHEVGHFRLLLFFPLRTKPLYLNNRRKWFFIRFPGAASSQSGWHHDPGSLGEQQKDGTRAAGNCECVAQLAVFLARRSPAPVVRRWLLVQ